MPAKIECDAEIKTKNGFEKCHEQAKYARLSSNKVTLCYCEKHKDRAFNPKPSHFKPYPGSQAYEFAWK